MLYFARAPVYWEHLCKYFTDAPSMLHTPSIPGVSRTFRTPEYWEHCSTGGLKILRVLRVWAVLKAQIRRVLGVWAVKNLEYRQYPQYRTPKYYRQYPPYRTSKYCVYSQYISPKYFQYSLKFYSRPHRKYGPTPTRGTISECFTDAPSILHIESIESIRVLVTISECLADAPRILHTPSIESIRVLAVCKYCKYWGFEQYLRPEYSECC